MSDYFVLAITAADWQKVNTRLVQVILEGDERTRKVMAKDPGKQTCSEIVEIRKYDHSSSSSDVRYKDFTTVYFLNDVAIRMLRDDFGSDVSGLEIIAEKDLPADTAWSSKAPYLPRRYW